MDAAVDPGDEERDEEREVADEPGVPVLEPAGAPETAATADNPATTGDDSERSAARSAAPSVLDRIQDDLDGVERALQRLDDGSYGTCEACGAAIDDERLADRPITRLCPEHQATAASTSQG